LRWESEETDELRTASWESHFGKLYAVWMERKGTRIATALRLAAQYAIDFLGTSFIVDEAEVELNRMYALEDEGSEGINEYVLHLQASEFSLSDFPSPRHFVDTSSEISLLRVA